MTAIKNSTRKNHSESAQKFAQHLLIAVEPMNDADWSNYLAGIAKANEEKRLKRRLQFQRARGPSVRARRRENHSQTLRHNIGSRMAACLRGIKRDKGLFSRLNYSLESLIAHLESKFTDGMSWENYGKWHVDHIKPCALFDMTKPEDFQQCWSLSNLQPLWALDNYKKGVKYAQS
jgi:hypothetical protein